MKQDKGIHMGDLKMEGFTNRDRSKGFFFALSAGVIWSFGALAVRHMSEAQTYRWQYLFFRGLTIAAVLLIFMIGRDGVSFAKSFKKVGLSGLIGACGLVTAFSAFIWSITLTTVANTLFMFAAMPFITAILGIVLLHEKLRPATWVAMAIALAGILVMVAEGLEAGNILGNLIALVSAAGFSVFSISLRQRKETPQFTTVALAGILCALLTLLILFLHNDTLAMPARNVALSMLHGLIVGVGLILFSLGARFFPAAELTLLSLVEIVGGVFWVYLPIFGIHEVPSLLTIAGGSMVLFAIMIDALKERFTKPVLEPA
jgi:drug/metabolite transporter (DMT)-like permease